MVITAARAGDEAPREPSTTRIVPCVNPLLCGPTPASIELATGPHAGAGVAASTSMVKNVSLSLAPARPVTGVPASKVTASAAVAWTSDVLFDSSVSRTPGSTRPPPAVTANDTVAPATPLSNSSATRTTTGSARVVPFVADCSSPETWVTAAGGPATAVAVNAALPEIVRTMVTSTR